MTNPKYPYEVTGDAVSSDDEDKSERTYLNGEELRLLRDKKVKSDVGSNAPSENDTKKDGA
jgi:hypothetical protein